MIPRKIISYKTHLVDIKILQFGISCIHVDTKSSQKSKAFRIEKEKMSDKPRVLVLGGTGMIGRNFVKFLVDQDLASSIRVADKTMPEIAYFSEIHRAAFADPRVTFVQVLVV